MVGNVCVMFLGLALVSTQSAAESTDPPMVPVGLDAYRMWDRWPYQRIGVRAYMRSTYDRSGANGDASNFLYQEADDFNVTLDVENGGVLYFVRTNHWHGSPWHYEVDGKDHLVQESSSKDPLHPVEESVFLPEALFPNPLTWTWSITKGADLMWVPIPFENTFRLAYSRTFYGTGYYIYHQFVPGTPLSMPLKSWDGKTPPGQDVLDLVGRAGTDIAPHDIEKVIGRISIGKSENIVITSLDDGPSVLRALKLTFPREQALALERARLRVTWDGRDHPSIDAPLCLFFGAGTFYNRDDREFLVKAFPMNIRFDATQVHLACYFPMPFFKSARFELTNIDVPSEFDMQYELRFEPFLDPPQHAGYFHATYRDTPEPESGKDVLLLDTAEEEGSEEWSGSFVGTTYIFSHRAVLSTLEGDPRFFFDDSRTPQAQGTGSEEWGGGGDYWGGQNMTIPFAGHPCGAVSAEAARDPKDLIESAYRFLLADLMPFGRRAVIGLEHGGVNQSVEHYETVTYWYGLPSPSLIKTDELDVGNIESERAHDYHSPDASASQSITSRYELGVDSRRFDIVAEAHPLADPEHYADFEFEADAGKTYSIWVRGHATDIVNHPIDGFWLQFDDQIGTTTMLSPELEKSWAGHWFLRSWSLDFSWGGSEKDAPPLTVVFDAPGPHRLRIQPRAFGPVVDQIRLTSETAEPPEGNSAAARAPKPKPGKIDTLVLDASDVTRCGGVVRIEKDPQASIGRAIHSIHPGIEVYPAHTETERHTKGASEFTMKLEPDNLGVMLRRTLDYAFPNQRAVVYVADVSNPEEGGPNWGLAGVWRLAGSNTSVASWPKSEVGETQHNVRVSNRRFRDDEFLIGGELTEGRSAIRIKVVFTPVEKPLFPGHPLAELAWSEIRYTAYCYVLPKSPV